MMVPLITPAPSLLVMAIALFPSCKRTANREKHLITDLLIVREISFLFLGF
jgi:hypothetical protein